MRISGKTGIALACGVAAGLLAYNYLPRTPRPEGESSQGSPAMTSAMVPAPVEPRMTLQPTREQDTNGPPAINRLLQWVKDGEIPKLTPEQLESYVATNRRSAGSLLAAFRSSGDKAWLLEALQNYPNDPRVNYAAVFKADSPEERSARLQAFERTAPENAMANYLTALDWFKAGQPGLALQEVQAAALKPTLEDYSLDFMQNAEEAYAASGYSPAEAKLAASSSLLLPQLAELKQVGVQLVEQANVYRQAGDAQSAAVLTQEALSLGQRLETSSGPLIGQLVGSAIERLTLAKLDPATAYDNNGQTVQERMDELAQQRSQVRTMNQAIESIIPSLPEPDLVNYLERRKTFGWRSASDWLLAKYGSP